MPVYYAYRQTRDLEQWGTPTGELWLEDVSGNMSVLKDHKFRFNKYNCDAKWFYSHFCETSWVTVIETDKVSIT